MGRGKLRLPPAIEFKRLAAAGTGLQWRPTVVRGVTWASQGGDAVGGGRPVESEGILCLRPNLTLGPIFLLYLCCSKKTT